MQIIEEETIVQQFLLNCVAMSGQAVFIRVMNTMLLRVYRTTGYTWIFQKYFTLLCFMFHVPFQNCAGAQVRGRHRK